MKLFAFFYFELIEAQREQASRLRRLRQRLETENGLEIDAQQLQQDWTDVNGYLGKATKKQ